ncbi:MAG: hypothetical protein ABSH49_22235 [Bryobacteraceae bacterium]
MNSRRASLDNAIYVIPNAGVLNSSALLVFLGLGTFLVYANWAAFQGKYYTFGPYISPFYSPELWGSSPHAWFGPNWLGQEES